MPGKEHDARQTPVVQELMVLAGVEKSFALAAELLTQMSGLVVSESTVKRLTEHMGQELKRRQDAGETFTAEQPWDWSQDQQGQRVGYVSMDLASARMQGPHGESCEGQIAKVARLYDPGPDENTAGKSLFIASFGSQAQLAQPLSAHATALSGDMVQQWIAVLDGGAGLGDALRRQFPFLVEIRDFWHVKEYLVELSQQLYPGDAACRAEWLTARCHELKHAGGVSVCRTLEQLALPPRQPPVAIHAGENLEILPQPRSPDGLSALRFAWLANRLRAGRSRLQTRRENPPVRPRHALAHPLRRIHPPPPLPADQQFFHLAIVFFHSRLNPTHLKDAYTASTMSGFCGHGKCDMVVLILDH